MTKHKLCNLNTMREFNCGWNKINIKKLKNDDDVIVVQTSIILISIHGTPL